MAPKTKVLLQNEINKIYANSKKDGKSLQEYLGQNTNIQFTWIDGVITLQLEYVDKKYIVTNMDTGTMLVKPFTNKVDGLSSLVSKLEELGLRAKEAGQTEVFLEKEESFADQNLINFDMKLDNASKREIENVFKDAKDFREIWEKITAPFDSIISESARVIDTDPIMNVSDELTKMNGEVQTVYEEIINDDGKVMRVVKSIPIIWSLAKTLDKKFDEASFNIKGIEGKIQTIFWGFDTSYTSLNTSIDMQKKFIDAIDKNIGTVEAYHAFIQQKMTEFNDRLEATISTEEKDKLTLFIRNVEFFSNNLQVLIWNLKMTKKRLEMKLDSAQKLSLSMNSSRPIFKTLLSTAMIESSSQKALDASMKAMKVMSQTIDKMSSELTDRAIESSKRTEEISSSPALSSKVFVENVRKLKDHFDSIEQFRAQVREKALQEQADFDQAAKELNQFKVLSKEKQDELEKELLGK